MKLTVCHGHWEIGCDYAHLDLHEARRIFRERIHVHLDIVD